MGTVGGRGVRGLKRDRTSRNEARRMWRRCKTRDRHRKSEMFRAIQARNDRRATRFEPEKKKKRPGLLVGTWNTRGLGAPFAGVDQTVKYRVMFCQMETWGWDVAMLSDIRWEGSGVREYCTRTQTWVVVWVGKAGIALSEKAAGAWRKHGARLCSSETGAAGTNRVVGVQLPKLGWMKGYFLVSAYAPTTSAGRAEKAVFLEHVRKVLQRADAYSIPIIGGDFNAQVGKSEGGLWANVMGQYGGARGKGGPQVLEWCAGEGLMVANTLGQSGRQEYATWFQPRYKTGHTLDYVLFLRRDRWHFRSCRVRQPKSGETWTLYTDHRPVEASFRGGKMWAEIGGPDRGRTPARPNVEGMIGPGEAPKGKKVEWAAAVEARIAELEGRDVEWDDLAKMCEEEAFRAFGERKKYTSRPWLEGREVEIDLWDRRLVGAREAHRNAKGAPRPWNFRESVELERSRRLLRDTLKLRSKNIARMEMDWYESVSREANEAYESGDLRTVFKAHAKLGVMNKGGRRDGAKKMVADPEREREAWRIHFSEIQRGRERVSETVWENVPTGEEQPWLSSPPTFEEVVVSIKGMKVGRAAGEDGFVAEYLKYGGPGLTEIVVRLVRRLWEGASGAEAGLEARSWPQSWCRALVVPMWKRKGCAKDKNNYRGITLLNVGSKVLARIVATRVAKWAEGWLGEENSGFRRGRGVDDALQVSRRLVEELAHVQGENVTLFRFYDIEKAYPRVSRDGLWELMRRRGCPEGMLNVCKALHEHTEMFVRIHGGISRGFLPDKGLREGCPSSPVLFNVFHWGVLTDFRTRRAKKATEDGRVPGIEWSYKVDGKIAHGTNERAQKGRHIGSTIFGDLGFADDTAIVGDATEVREAAEPLLLQTMADWRERNHSGKTEGLRLNAPPRAPFDVGWMGEKSSVRHVGGWLAERGGTDVDTNRRISAVVSAVHQVTRPWGRTGPRGERRRGRIARSVKIRILKSVVLPTATAFGGTRKWTGNEVLRLQRVVNKGVRRVFGMRQGLMHDHHVSDAALCKAAQWEPVENTLARRSLHWLGRVARMDVSRMPKQALFGWWGGHRRRNHAPMGQRQWLSGLVKRTGLRAIDWFRVAQDKRAWNRIIDASFPVADHQTELEARVDTWRLGRALPQLESDGGTEAQGGAEDPGDPEDQGGANRCPVCGEVFAKANQFQFHYEECHAVCDPHKVTAQTFQCDGCKQSWRRVRQRTGHVCPAETPPVRWGTIDGPGQAPGPPTQPLAEGPIEWRIYTDGSGGKEVVGEGALRIGGWGVAVYQITGGERSLHAKLYGPVVTEKWDTNWIGAEVHSSNTAEVTAIGEALHWLIDEAPKGVFV